MAVATAGVPQAAASVRVMPQPSRCELLATTQARRYHDTSSSSSTWPGRLTQSVAPSSARSASSAGRSYPSPMMTARRSGWSSFTLASARSSASKRLTGTRRPTATTRGTGERTPPGV